MYGLLASWNYKNTLYEKDGVTFKVKAYKFHDY